MDADTIGGRIAIARRAKGLARQQDLANLVAKGRQGTISDWENGSRTPTPEKLVELVRALDVSGHWLLTGDGPMRLDPSERERAYREIAAIVLETEGCLPESATGEKVGPDD